MSNSEQKPILKTTSKAAASPQPQQSGPQQQPSNPMSGPQGAPGPTRSPGARTGDRVAPSIIGEDLSITGNVISKGEVQVDGQIEGDVHCGSLIVGEKAEITGGIVAEDVVVRGRVMGSVRGVRVTMQASSHVEGDVFHKALAIEQGAFFEGKSRRAEDPIATAPKLETPQV